MKINIVRTVPLLLACMLLACSKGSDSPDNGEQSQNPPTEQQVWNKNKTIKINYFSSLDGKTIESPDATKLIDYINKNVGKDGMSLVDGVSVPVSRGEEVNLVSKIAFETATFPSFVVRNIDDTKMEGTCLLVNHKIDSEEAFALSDQNYLKYTFCKGVSIQDATIAIDVPLATVSYRNKEEIQSSANQMRILSQNKHMALVVGTVGKTLWNDLEKMSKDIPNYTLTKVNEVNSYILFILAPKTWVLRDTKINSIVNQINCFTMFIEASVH